MKLVYWNCRGLGNPSKAKAVKDLLKIETPDILMLRESNIEGETLLEMNKLKWGKMVERPQGACNKENATHSKRFNLSKRG